MGGGCYLKRGHRTKEKISRVLQVLVLSPSILQSLHGRLDHINCAFGIHHGDHHPDHVRTNEGPPPMNRLGSVRVGPLPALSFPPAHPARHKLVCPKYTCAKRMECTYHQLRGVSVPRIVKDTLQPNAAKNAIDNPGWHFHGQDHLVDACFRPLVVCRGLQLVAAVVVTVAEKGLTERVPRLEPILPLRIVEEGKQAHLPAEVNVKVGCEPHHVPFLPVGQHHRPSYGLHCGAATKF
mmetsp:Transcript_34913/g.80427  ORF Transcript_34913/g.80427 Transcript_34913/m.80427 type:complete len:237 (-) Transcript_34913:32-742(-)